MRLQRQGNPTCAGHWKDPEAGERNLGGPRRWRLLDTGFAHGSWNLALDEALFTLADRGRTVPTIRFYGWSPPAVSVGYFQKWERELDPDICRERNIPIYRRVTGGKAVYHDRETTYSVICSRDVNGFSEGLMPVYKKIAQGLLAGLRILGVDAQVAAPSRGPVARQAVRNPSCFAAASGYELSAGGKKLVGSAQKRSGGAVLQHGSILHSLHNEKLAGLLRRDRAASLPPTASLDSIIRRRPEHGEVVSALREGFEKAWGIVLLSAPLTEEEMSLARRLSAQRYGSLTT